MSDIQWRETTVAPDGTHHQEDGRAFYDARFDRVLKYHDPGLAPVVDSSGAYHIDLDGQPVYVARHVRTFGYYEGRAAVQEVGDWFHILADGEPLYEARYAWCGNYQEGRSSVRDSEGGYFHLDRRGNPVYPAQYRYAGDYRDGYAVVQRDDGHHTHIDQHGGLLHGRWFLDLDVFHKGYARARDTGGWHHIDHSGTASYRRRFASLEPFYNGQARVEHFDGGLEVIGEDGGTITELRPGLRSAFSDLSTDMVGFWRTWTLCVAAELQVVDRLPCTTAEVARRCGVVEPMALRLLKALGELEVVLVHGDTWHATSKGEYLRNDHPATLRDAAIEYGRRFSQRWSRLGKVLLGQASADDDLFEEVAGEPERCVGFHRMLRSYARMDYERVVEVVQLEGIGELVDAGGGLGVIAAHLLDAHPHLRVTLLDRQEVLSMVPTPAPYAGRLVLHPADLFSPWGVKADAVLLARVLHDWDDASCRKILDGAKSALSPGGRLFIIEMVRVEDNHNGSLCDLHLLVNTGGAERSLVQFTSLLEPSGFHIKEVKPLGAVQSVVVAEAT